METSLSGAMQEVGWALDPSILIGLAALISAYAIAANPALRPARWRSWGPQVSALRQVSYYAGMLIVFLALCSPLDGLGDEYLFTAHMVQHLMLTLLAPPLWLLGLPAWMFERLLPAGRVRRVAQWVIAPAPAFIIFNGVMWGWHVPAAYDAALEHEWLHIIEHLMFMGAATVGWAPALMPRPVNRLPDVTRALYLVATTFPCTALAALMTLPGAMLYPFYQEAPRILNLTPLGDQQLGGLLMWLPSDMIFMAFALVFFGRWLGRQGSSAVHA